MGYDIGNMAKSWKYRITWHPVSMALEVDCLVTTVSVASETTNSNSLLPNTASNHIQQHVNSANSGDVDDSQSDCHSDSDSCAPDVIVTEASVFISIKKEQKYPWLYHRVVHQEY